MQIQRARESDASTLTDLSRATFIETFAPHNSEKDIEEYVTSTFASEKQLAEIRDPNRIIEIAWIDGQAVGFLHLLKGKPDDSVRGPKPIEVLRLYVGSQWHGKGVGAALMDRCIDVARETGFQTLWLGVWDENHRAQAFYKKYEFKTVGQHVFRLGKDEQNDLVMVRAI